MSRAIGIDLGTTNSCVAVLEGGEPAIITSAEQPLRLLRLRRKVNVWWERLQSARR